MKRIFFILAVIFLAACSANHKRAAAQVCTSVANCCRSVNSTLGNGGSGSKEKSSVNSQPFFSLSMHELSTEVFTW